MKQQSTPRGEQPTPRHVETFPPCRFPLTQLKRPHTYYGFQNDSQNLFHQSRKPISIVLGFQVGIHNVSFAGRAESEREVRTSHLCPSYSKSHAASKAGFVLEGNC